MTNWKRLALDLVIGIVGCLVALVIWHLYQDHQMFHQMITLAQRRTIRQNIDLKDVPPNYQPEMLEMAGMMPPQQQGQQQGGQPMPNGMPR